MEIQDLIFIIIAIFIAVLLLKVFMWLLPVFVVLIIAFLIYMYLKEHYDHWMSVNAEVAATAPSPHATTHCLSPTQTSPTAYT